MTAYYTPDNSFTANDASCYTTLHIAVSLQLPSHATDIGK